MNNLLKCFFEHFEHTERSSLHARYKRRAMVEYLNTLIEGCRLGENGDVQKIVREAIVCILRYHATSKNNNGSVCMMGKYHNVLYVGLKLCFDWQLKDTETIATLLDEIYSCEKTFERLFVGALFGTRAPHFIAGWKSDFQDQEENVRAVVYFLDLATNANLEYSYGTEEKVTRFIDIPIESCGISCLKIILQLGIPDTLHIFLRFGAIVYDEDKYVTVIDMLLIRLSELKHTYPYNLVSCLQLILRVIPSIYVRPTNFLPHTNETNIQRDAILDRFPYLVQDCILPLNRCGLQPPELKHLSRCIIRHQLWLNYQLPNGIRMLPVPDSMHRYIDIMDD